MLLGATACGFSGHGRLDDASPQVDAPTSDASATSDAVADDGAPSCATWAPRNITNLCARPAPNAGGVTVDKVIAFDTDTGMFEGAGAPATPISFVQTQVGVGGNVDALVMSVESLTITNAGELRVKGTRPLIILSWSTIDVVGNVDAGSRGTTQPGGGVDPTDCVTHTMGIAGTSDAGGGGSGGGGGGGFHGAGGMGGPGDTGTSNPGGSGGTTIVLPDALRGGCSGGKSGAAGPDPSVTVDDATRTAGGFGGGAVQLSARTSIAFAGSGRVRANGGGGAGAVSGSANGGGGGGSGGMIALDTPLITASNGARISATSGGGGSGGPFAKAGKPGGDGKDDGNVAGGGASVDPCAPAGADGAVTLQGANASQTTVACGGGGGGGGVGFIVVYGNPTLPPGITFVPAVTAIP